MIYLISLIIALSAAAVEAVSYPGYIHNHFGIHSYVLYLLSFALSLFPHRIPKQLKVIFPIVGYATATMYLILIFAETINYPNFVFTKTHINPFMFQFMVAFLWFHIITIKGTNFVKSLLLTSLIYVGLDGAGRTLSVAYRGLDQIVRDPLATYSAKMTKVYPGFYPAMQEIKRLTPSNSTILIPPQGNPWELEGNGAMVTYFLYPRKVQNSVTEEINSSIKANTYLMIAKGSWKRTGERDYGWPKVKVKANTIWEFDTKHSVTNIYERDYDPKTDKWDWGLIEVKHE